jgi:hypothetical protein
MKRERVHSIYPWCDTCQTVRRKPEGDGRTCPLCGGAVLSTEQLNEPNHLLYRHWRLVFRRVPGFEHCVCLRRARCPDRSRDMDFLLLEPWPQPKLGLVEVEGWSSLRDVPMPLWKGLEQVTRYVEIFRRYAGQGSIIRRESVDNSFDSGLLRGRSNLAYWKSPAHWIGALGRTARQRDFDRVLSAASRTLVPVLLSFRRADVGANVLTAGELASVQSRLRGHRLYVGAVAWPTADRLLGGQFVQL